MARMNSFDDVVKRYNETVPLRGARKAQDIRPIAERRYWWVRIEKINDNKYALHDGMWTWNRQNNQGMDAYDLEPITWERKADGDYITIRNCPNDGMSISRYNFLRWYLPEGLSFDYNNTGRHWVTDGKRVQHYLPKYKCKWNNYNPANSHATFEMIEDNKLVFKHTPEGFVRVNELQPMPTRRIDKELTKHYDVKTKELYDWMQAVLPILGETLNDYSTRNQYANALHQGAGFWYWTRYVEPMEMREILDDPEHEKRMPFAVMSAFEAGMFNDGSTQRFTPSKEGFSRLKQVVRKVAKLYAVELK